MSRTSAGAELSDALQAVGSATKDKAADTAKKVKTKTAEGFGLRLVCVRHCRPTELADSPEDGPSVEGKAGKRRRRAAQAERRAAATMLR